MNEKEVIGQRIKNIRVTRKETLEEFARKIRNETDGKIKTTKSNVSKWEKGLNIPNDITLKAIANLGGVSTDYILHGEKELPSTFTSTFFNEDLQKQIIDLQKSFSLIISTNQKNDSLNDLRADLLTKDINFETNKESESLNKTLEVLENYLNALTDRSIKINYSELMLLKEIITLFSDVRDSSISNEEQFFIYSSLTDTINQIRKNLN